MANVTNIACSQYSALRIGCPAAHRLHSQRDVAPQQIAPSKHGEHQAASTPVHKRRPGGFTNRSLGDTLAFMSESRTAQRNIWAQLGVSAGVLLLPPMALGAAVYSMLPARDEGGGRAIASTVTGGQPATPRFRAEAGQAWPINGDSQPAANATEALLAAGKLALAADERSPSTPNARPEPVSKKDPRVLGSLPLRVTVVAPPAAVSPHPSANVDSARTGSTELDPWLSAAAQIPKALLPRAPTSLLQAPPQIPPPQVPASQAPVTQIPVTQVPTLDRPSAEGPPQPAPTTRKHTRSSYLRTLARRSSGVHAEARSETHAVRQNASPQSQQTSSLKTWLQQLSASPHQTGN